MSVELFHSLSRRLGVLVCDVSGSSVNRGVGLGVEIPRKYKFYGRQAYVDRLQILAVQTMTVIDELHLLCLHAVGTAY